jgi:hypothetical protein
MDSVETNEGNARQPDVSPAMLHETTPVEQKSSH